MSANYDPTITPEMHARYIERRRADLATLDVALAADDFETIAKITHQIKGNAATFSFDDLESFAIALERATETKNKAEAQINIESIRHWLNTQTENNSDSI